MPKARHHPSWCYPLGPASPLLYGLSTLCVPCPTRITAKKVYHYCYQLSTRWPISQAVRKNTSNDVWCFIDKKNISKFGKPELPITNGGKELTSDNTNVYLTRQEVKHTVTTPYHHQANSRVERLSGSLVQELAKLTARKPGNGPRNYLLLS